MPDVPSITSAGRGATDQVHDRTTRYLLSMLVRTVCFVAAFLTDGWVRWTCVALAVVLPYLAVVLANAGAERRQTTPAYLENPSIGPAPGDDPELRGRED